MLTEAASAQRGLRRKQDEPKQHLGWVEVGIGETVGFDALHEEGDRRSVSDIRGICDATTASEEAADTSKAVDDNSARVAPIGESARLGVVWEYSPFLGSFVAILKVHPDIRHNAASTADGHTGGATVLDHHQAWIVILVQQGWVTHLLVRDGTLELQEAVRRILDVLFLALGYIFLVNSEIGILVPRSITLPLNLVLSILSSSTLMIA